MSKPIMQKDDQSCRTCYFSASTDQVGMYLCQARPPQVVAVPVTTIEGQGIGFQSVFPMIPAETWCGLWAEQTNPFVETRQ